MTLSLTLVMCAGPPTEPHRRREDVMSVTVREAKYSCPAVREERSTQHDVRFESVQGVEAVKVVEGRIMWVDDCEDTEIVCEDVAVRELEVAGLVAGSWVDDAASEEY